MGIDVVDLVRIDPGMLHGHEHAPRGALALGERLRHVLRVGAESITRELAIDPGPTVPGVLEFFKDH